MKWLINRMSRGRRKGRGERGVQLVEVAIIMPVLLLLFAVTAEFGRMFFIYTTLAKGTRVASRYLTTVPLNTADNRLLYGTKAKNLVVYGTTTPDANAQPIVPGLTTSKVVITQSGGVATTIPEFVKVEITGMTYTPLLDLGGLLDNDSFSLSIPMAPSVTLRYLITQPIN
jgi:Flp pilus assembly protein TadG